jgi:hypothetical protein
MGEPDIDDVQSSSTTKDSPCAGTKTKPEQLKEAKELPKLTGSEFRAYNRMAETMEYYVSLKI